MTLSDLIHFKQHGWCILADIIDVAGCTTYVFFTIYFKPNGKPVIFQVPEPKNGFGQQIPEKCKLRYFDIDDMSTIREGQMIFYFVDCKVRFGKITRINNITHKVIIDHKFPTKMITLLAYDHNFEEIKDDKVYICKHCMAVHTPKIRHLKVVS